VGAGALNGTRDLAHGEHVTVMEWSVEDGALTPSMKLKRRVVESRYAKEIGEFYADEATASKV